MTKAFLELSLLIVAINSSTIKNRRWVNRSTIEECNFSDCKRDAERNCCWFTLVACIFNVAFHEYLIGNLRKFCIIHGWARARSAVGDGCPGASHLLTILNLSCSARSKRHFSARTSGIKTVPRTRLRLKKSHQGDALKKARRRSRVGGDSGSSGKRRTKESSRVNDAER